MSHLKKSRFIIGLLILLLPMVYLLGTDAPVSSTSPMTDAWSRYAADPDNNPNIPNNSFAGYAYGEKPIPYLPAVINARDFGAVGDGATDSTEAIDSALKAASDAGGGAVLLPRGTYVISDVIIMNHSGIVLRGEGSGATTLKFTLPLKDAYGRLNDMDNVTDESDWTNTGGLIWFTPYSRERASSGMSKTACLANITSDSKRGDRLVKVSSSRLLRPGQRVFILYRNTHDLMVLKQMAGGVTGAESFDWEKNAKHLFNRTYFEWPVEISSVQGQDVILKQPLRLDIPADIGCEIWEIIPPLTKAGVEDLAIELPDDYSWAHHQEQGYHGILFKACWDCWARNVTVKNSENAISVTDSKCISVENTTITGKRGHHGLFTARAYDCIFKNFDVESPVFHGLNVSSGNGNVFSDGIMKHGTFDYHCGMPFDIILTNIEINNDGIHGGDKTTPMYGGRIVHWNIEITNGRAGMVYAPDLIPSGAVVGVRGASLSNEESPDFTGDLRCLEEASGTNGRSVEPLNLHQAQLQLRLGTEKPSNNKMDPVQEH